MTLIELSVVLVIITIFAALLLPAITRSKARSKLIYCNNNLKQIGLAYRIWETDHKYEYPMSVSQINGGTKEFVTGLNAFRHFQVMSNELSTPYILICPAEADRARVNSTNFTAFNNSNLSYFVGVDANESNVQMILSGDRNITNGRPVKNGLLEVTTNTPASWSGELHDEMGNMALADGSVQEASDFGLQSQIAGTGVATNWLLMPVLGP